MHQLFEKIDELEIKSRQLIHQMQGLKQENDLLVKENKKNKIELKQYIDKIEGLRIAVENNKSNGDIDKKMFKRRIEQYVEEIDKCIKLLNE